MTAFSDSTYKDRLKNANWTPIYESSCPDFIANYISNTISNILHDLCPIKITQARKHKPKGLSPEIINTMRTRDNSHRKAIFTGLDNDWRHYRQLKNSCTNMIKKHDKDRVKMRIDKATEGGDPKTIWSTLKDIIGYTKPGPPTKLKSGGTLHTKPIEIANILNDFFINKVKNIVETKVTIKGDPLKHLRNKYNNWENKPTTTFSLTKVSAPKVLKIINNLSQSKASGIDNIGTNFVKLGAQELKDPITHLINCSIDGGTFPELYKTHNIAPIYKGSNMLDPSGYRPIALLCSISKILEKVVCEQFTDYLENNKLISTNHHAYRKGLSTTTAIAQLEDIWHSCHHINQAAVALLVDSSAAFDCVSWDLLIEKLSIYGVKNNELKWFTSYLTGRKQRVTIGGAYSQTKSLCSGVPQGSILGPLLYTLFTNELTDLLEDEKCKDSCHSLNREYLFGATCLTCGTIVCYADDATATITGTEKQLQTKIDSCMATITNFLTLNRLKINNDKTVLLRIVKKGQGSNIINDPLYYISDNNKIITPTQKTKLLGIMINNKLSWHDHIFNGKESIKSFINNKLGSIYNICKNLTTDRKLKLIEPLITSKITYIIQAWGSLSKSDLRDIQTSQNKAARRALNIPIGSNTVELMEKCNWLSIKQLIWYHTLILLWKIIKTTRLPYFKSQISFTRDRAPNLRRLEPSGNIYLNTHPNTIRHKNSFIHRGATMWNSLPANIKNSLSYTVFKKQLKIYIRANIEVHGNVIDLNGQ